MLVKVYPKGKPEQSRMMYSLIDDQSNRSLATSNFCHLFCDNGPETEYVLSSCAGKFTTSGRLARDYVVEALDGSCAFDLPTIIEYKGPHQLVDADSDKEIRPDVQVAKTQTVDQNNVHKLGTHRFSKFSEWRTLVRAISLLKQFVRNLAHHNDKPEHLDAYKQPDSLKQAQQVIILEVQMENYRNEIGSIKHGTSLHNNSSLSQNRPYLMLMIH
ncbi:unnamed protein product [Mytilus edulis]|uniref:Uncharacterized protein n=1 Tax=Mytilus edulis TaxID=6550 RepID=A0A8S3T937_MYTED|nr:unnamed protein product [Mytilus edulis]